MTTSPRLFLFHGTDSQASRRAVRQWEQAFLHKYGDATRYIIEADEVGAQGAVRLLAEYLTGQSLFSIPKLIVVKRFTSQDRPPAHAATTALLKTIEEMRTALDATVTLAIWEDRLLSDSHPLLKKCAEWQREGLARIRSFKVPRAAEVGKVAAIYVEEAGSRLASEGERWLSQQYELIERHERLRLRTKPGSELAQDERGWWLYQLLDTALLRAHGGVVGVAELEAGSLSLTQPVGAFDLIGVISANRFSQARAMLAQLGEEADDSFLFSLLAVWKWQSKRLPSAKRIPLHKLLIEAELVAKNFPVQPVWLIELLICRLEESASTGNQRSLFNQRRLWLATLLRS